MSCMNQYLKLRQPSVQLELVCVCVCVCDSSQCSNVWNKETADPLRCPLLQKFHEDRYHVFPFLFVQWQTTSA